MKYCMVDYSEIYEFCDVDEYYFIDLEYWLEEHDHYYIPLAYENELNSICSELLDYETL